MFDTRFLTFFYTTLLSSGGLGHTSYILIIYADTWQIPNIWFFFSLLSPPSSFYQSTDLALDVKCIPNEKRDQQQIISQMTGSKAQLLPRLTLDMRTMQLCWFHSIAFSSHKEYMMMLLLFEVPFRKIFIKNVENFCLYTMRYEFELVSFQLGLFCHQLFKNFTYIIPVTHYYTHLQIITVTKYF